MLFDDYSVSCDHSTYKLVRTLDAGIIIVFVVGLPSYLLYQLTQGCHRHTDKEKQAELQYVANRAAELLGVNQGDAHDAVADVLYGERYSFLTAGYRPNCQWYECCDMFRKLTMVLTALVFGSGSTEQAFAVLSLSFFWCTLLVFVRPYRFAEDFALKVASEFAIVVSVASVQARISVQNSAKQLESEHGAVVTRTP